MGSCKVSRVFNVSHTTPERYVQDRQESSNQTITTKLGRKQVLPCEAEHDLARVLSFPGKKVFWLDSGRRHASRLPTYCKKRNSKPILQEK